MRKAFGPTGVWLRTHKILAAFCGMVALVLSALTINLLTREEPVMQQPYATDYVISSDGTKIGYRQYGQGPGIILVHGGLMAAQDFNDLASLLADDFAVYVPDRRGRGLSGHYTKDHSIQKEVEDMQALLNKTGAHCVFGLSAGAIIALESTLRLSQIERLAIYEPPIPLKGQVSTVSWLPRYDKELAEGDLGGAMITVVKGTGDSSFLAKMPRFIGEPFMNFAIKAQAKESKPGEVLLKDLIPTMHYDAPVVAGVKDKIKPFGAIKVPVLLLSGTKSPANLQAPIQALHAILPQAKHVNINGAGHLAATNGEEPRVVANALREFFER